jgi:predicted nucleic acid-binding protein
VDRVFLDANVLFSAAYRPTSKLRELWRRPDVELLTSAYAVEEALRNLDDGEQRQGLGKLLESVTVVGEAPGRALQVELAAKDRPILAAAIEARATYLLTGDLRDFGRFLGQSVEGVRIVQPAEYLRDPGGRTTRQRKRRS